MPNKLSLIALARVVGGLSLSYECEAIAESLRDVRYCPTSRLVAPLGEDRGDFQGRACGVVLRIERDFEHRGSPDDVATATQFMYLLYPTCLLHGGVVEYEIAFARRCDMMRAEDGAARRLSLEAAQSEIP